MQTDGGTVQFVDVRTVSEFLHTHMWKVRAVHVSARLHALCLSISSETSQKADIIQTSISSETHHTFRVPFCFFFKWGHWCGAARIDKRTSAWSLQLSVFFCLFLFSPAALWSKPFEWKQHIKKESQVYALDIRERHVINMLVSAKFDVIIRPLRFPTHCFLASVTLKANETNYISWGNNFAKLARVIKMYFLHRQSKNRPDY